MMEIKTAKQWKAIYSSEEFKEKYDYDGSLGAEYGKGQTVFRVWSPYAESVVLNLYLDGGASAVSEKVSLVQGEKGVWEYTSEGDSHGSYYDYEIGRAHV